QRNYNVNTGQYYLAGADRYNALTINITVNSNTIASFQSDPYEIKSGEASYYLNAGDLVEIEHRAPLFDTPYFQLLDAHNKSTVLKVYKTNQGNVELNEAFKDFKIKDFFKECLWRTATIPIINPETKHIYFLSIEQYLDTNRADDWTKFYVSRNKETYIQGSYAQKNVFKHKYNNPDDTGRDGYLFVANQNLAAEKTLAQSNIYAPENQTTTFNNIDNDQSFQTAKYSIWSK